LKNLAVESGRASRSRIVVAALVPSVEVDRQRLAQAPLQRPKISMEKPNARGPSPSRKAHFALRERLNRKPKLPPVPVKKNLSTAGRITAR
jgi:hypothetical protein